MSENDDYKPLPEEELNFYYKRSERLKRAPENVRRFYDGTFPKPPKGLFKALVHTNHGKFMLAAVGLSLAVVLGILLTGEKSNAKSAWGTDFVLTAFSFDDSVYVSLKTEAKSEVPDAEIRFSALDKDKKTLAVHEIPAFSGGTLTFYRTIFTDYDILFVEAEIRTGGETLTLYTRVEQK